MTGMWAIYIFLAGGVAGGCFVLLVQAARRECRGLRFLPRDPPRLPPATERAVRRDRRESRLDIRGLDVRDYPQLDSRRGVRDAWDREETRP